MKEVAPYVAVIDEGDYTSETIARLLSSSSAYAAGNDYGDDQQGGPLRGLLVLSSSNDSESNEIIPSPEPLTPQGDGTPMASLTIGSSYEWNVNNNGDSLSMTDLYGLPTAYIHDQNTAEYLRGVATDQANSSTSDSSGGTLLNAEVYPSIVSEFNYYMGPGNTNDDGDNAYTAKTCLEWKNNDGTW